MQRSAHTLLIAGLGPKPPSVLNNKHLPVINAKTIKPNVILARANLIHDRANYTLDQQDSSDIGSTWPTRQLKK